MDEIAKAMADIRRYQEKIARKLEKLEQLHATLQLDQNSRLRMTPHAALLGASAKKEEPQVASPSVPAKKEVPQVKPPNITTKSQEYADIQSRRKAMELHDGSKWMESNGVLRMRFWFVKEQIGRASCRERV